MIRIAAAGIGEHRESTACEVILNGAAATRITVLRGHLYDFQRVRGIPFDLTPGPRGVGVILLKEGSTLVGPITTATNEPFSGKDVFLPW